MTYRVEVILDDAPFAALESAWTDLLRAAGTTFFASWQWNYTWWQYFGAGKRLYLLAVYDAAGLAGVAPLMLRAAGPLRKLEFIGTGLSDAGDFVLHPARGPGALGAILDHLRAHQGVWDLVDLDEIPPYSLLAGALPPAHLAGLRVTPIARTDCPFMLLPDSWDDYLHTLSRKRRQVFERRARRLLDEYAAEFTVCTGGAAVGAAIGTLYRLHRARWAGNEAGLEPVHLTPAFPAFLEQVAERVAAPGWLRLAELRVGAQVIASSLSFLANSRWSGYLKGFDPDWAERGPGQVLDALSIRYAAGEHTREFDFGRGNEDYKYRFGAVSRQSSRLVLAGTTPRATAGHLLTALRLRGRALAHRGPAAPGAPGAGPPTPDEPSSP